MTAFHGESRPVRGARPAPASNAVHYDKEPHRRPAYHARGRGRHARRLRGRGRRGAALRRRGPARAVVSRARRRGLPGRDASATRSSSSPLRGRRTWARRTPRSPPLPPEPGAPRAPAARRRSSRWAAAASRWSRRTPRSTTTSARSRRRASRGSACCPTAGGDSEDQIRRFHAAFRDRSCEPTHISLFRLGDAPGAAARAPARAGHHLRRRRLDGQPARALARARARRDPARGLAARHRARRA